jgi:Fic family protein
MAIISMYEQFMVESNAIEGETGLNPNDIRAIMKVVKNPLETEKQLLEIHGILTKHLNVDWSGKYRTHDIMVTNSSTVFPHFRDVPEKMTKFFERLPRLTSFEAHNVYEHIHPFTDFNGRIGRLIWLSKALRETPAYRFNLPFLQAYYYQTLNYWSGGTLTAIAKKNGENND